MVRNHPVTPFEPNSEKRGGALFDVIAGIRVSTLHGMTIPTTNTELFGRLLCGVDSFGMKV